MTIFWLNQKMNIEHPLIIKNGLIVPCCKGLQKCHVFGSDMQCQCQCWHLTWHCKTSPARCHQLPPAAPNSQHFNVRHFSEMWQLNKPLLVPTLLTPAAAHHLHIFTCGEGEISSIKRMKQTFGVFLIVWQDAEVINGQINDQKIVSGDESRFSGCFVHV